MVYALTGLWRRDGQNPPAIGHYGVLSLADDSEASLLQGPHRLEVRNAGDLRHYTMTSISRTSAPLVCSATTAMYSWMADRMFSSASASFWPCDQQPGSPGTEAATPSFDR